MKRMITFCSIFILCLSTLFSTTAFCDYDGEISSCNAISESIKLDEIFDDVKKLPLNREQRRNMPKNMDNPAELQDVIKGPAFVVLPVAVYQ